tara:strand:+ start:251 stop:535 length:285 start_codon:yes stop_codon:yes gene_type:complete
MTQTITELLEIRRSLLVQRHNELLASVYDLEEVKDELEQVNLMLSISYDDVEEEPVEEVVEPIVAPVVEEEPSTPEPYVAQRMVPRPQGRFRYG